MKYCIQCGKEIKDTNFCPYCGTKQPVKEPKKEEAKKEEAKEKPEVKEKSRIETKAEAKAETKVETKAEAKAEAKAETKAETKAEPKKQKNFPVLPLVFLLVVAIAAIVLGKALLDHSNADRSDSGKNNVEKASEPENAQESEETKTSEVKPEESVSEEGKFEEGKPEDGKSEEERSAEGLPSEAQSEESVSSEHASGVPVLGDFENVSVAGADGFTMRITWNEIPGAAGYQVTGFEDGYARSVTTTNCYYEISGSDIRKISVKVRSFQKDASGGKIYSGWSETKEWENPQEPDWETEYYSHWERLDGSEEVENPYWLEEQNTEYLCTYSDARLLTVEDLDTISVECANRIPEGKTVSQMIINEMYAKHGYQFTTEIMQNYFNQYDWYRSIEPKISNMDDVRKSMNDIEIANIDFLSQNR